MEKRNLINILAGVGVAGALGLGILSSKEDKIVESKTDVIEETYQGYRVNGPEKILVFDEKTLAERDRAETPLYCSIYGKVEDIKGNSLNIGEKYKVHKITRKLGFIPLSIEYSFEPIIQRGEL